MKFTFLRTLFIVCIAAGNLGAQTIRLSPQVIASQGADFKNNDFEISYTIGELAAVSTISNTGANLTLTQGFHQPDKFSVVIGISEPEHLASATLYPNPANAKVFLSLESAFQDVLTADLFDATGRTIIASQKLIQVPGAQQFEFAIEGLAAGTYMIRLTAGNGTGQKTFRFTKVYH
jgi:hypothetical protein